MSDPLDLDELERLLAPDAPHREDDCGSDCGGFWRTVAFQRGQYEGLAALIAAARGQEWIPVGERLPEKLSDDLMESPFYLVTIATVDGPYTSAAEWYEDVDGSRYWGMAGSMGELLDGVTHWQPMPEPAA